MGYDINRFLGEVDLELLCPICLNVLEDPVQAVMCEHAFCRGCINEWLTRQPTCPVDGSALTTEDLKAGPRILRNLMSRLSIACENAPYGCTAVLTLDACNSHLEECIYNPNRTISCKNGCGFDIPRGKLKDHNCQHELRTLIAKQSEEMGQLKTELAEQQLTIKELKRELKLCKNFRKAMRGSNNGRSKKKLPKI